MLKYARVAISLSACFIFGLPAEADAGLPMIAIVWPTSFLLLVAIIPIEALIAKQCFNDGWRMSFLLAIVANMASVVVGIPLTWLGLVLLEIIIGGVLNQCAQLFPVSNGNNGVAVLMNLIAQSPWLVPESIFEPEETWVLTATSAILCLPFFLSSVGLEYFAVQRVFPSLRIRDRELRRWSWLANSTTYGCIILALLVSTGVMLWEHHRAFGFIDVSGNLTRTPAGTSELLDFSEGLAPFRCFDKWGYLDKAGNVAIKPQFERASIFSEGFALVTQDGRARFVDKAGLPLIGTFDEARPFAESLAVVRTGNDWGYIDKVGLFRIKPGFSEAESFSEGLAAVKIGERWGYIGRDGRLLIKPKFRIARAFSDGLASVVLESNVSCFIDHSGTEVITVPSGYAVKDFNEGLSAFESSGYWGYLDKSGMIAIKPTLDAVGSFSEGLAHAKTGSIREDGHSDYRSCRVGFIDKTGHFVITPQFEAAGSFSCNRAPICAAGRWGFIDKSGKTVIKPTFEAARSFRDGFASVGKRWKVDQLFFSW